jgi:heptose I phosphotransferase
MLVLPEAWLERWQPEDIFEQLFALQGTVYREQQGRKTLRFRLDGRNYFAKLHRGTGWKEIVENLLQLRLPVLSARTEWRAIKRLEALGIRTTPLVGYGKRGWNPARLQSFVITEELVNTVSLEDFCREWPTSPPDGALKRSLIAEVARIARMLHENGINHRDLYICHFLLEAPAGQGTKVDPHGLRLYLIDLHRMQMRPRTPWRWRVKDVAALYFSSMDIGLTRRDFLRFVRAYEEEPLRVCLNKNSSFWRHVESRAIALYRREFQRDPTLPW